MAEAKNEVSAAVLPAVLPSRGVNAVPLDAGAVEFPTDVNLNEFQGVVPIRNIGFLGRCFDFPRLDPLDLGERLRNGGGCMPTRAIEILPEMCDVLSPDRSVLIPRGTRYRSESRGERASRAQVWSSTSAFIDSFKSTVSTGFGIPEVFSFSASASYQDVYNSTTLKKQTMTFVQGSFEFCGVAFEDDFTTDPAVEDKLRLDPSFVAAVKGLQTAQDCKGIVEKFGTHYAREVIFGGRMYQRIHVSEAVKKDIEEHGRGLQASAEGTYRKATLSVGGGTSSSSSSTLESKQGITVEDIRWVGGTPSTSFDEWVKSVRDDPKPMQLDLEPLSNLFTEKYFPGIDIAKKKTWMEKAVIEHIKEVAEPVTLNPDLRRLADKEYYILNQGGAGNRVGLHLGFYNWNAKLRSPSEEKFPWKLVLVPGKTDEFHIQVRWNNQQGGSPSRLNNLLGARTGTQELMVEGKQKLFPWKLVPVPGKTDEYFLRCASDIDGGVFRGQGVGVGGDDWLKLYGPEDAAVVPWKLVPVTP